VVHEASSGVTGGYFIIQSQNTCKDWKDIVRDVGSSDIYIHSIHIYICNTVWGEDINIILPIILMHCLPLASSWWQACLECRRAAALAVLIKSIVNTVYILSCIIRCVFTVFFSSGLRPHISTDIPLINRSFHFGIAYTFSRTSLILVISKTWIWPFVIKNCSRNWQLTSSMELNSWEAARHSANEELPSVSWNPKVYYSVHKSTPLAPILNQINRIHTIPSYFSKIHFNIILPRIA
jgi:hypothetical protein